MSKLQPKVRLLAERLIEECEKMGLKIFVTRGLRSIAEQDKFYAMGRTEPGKIVTMAKGGDSFHNYGVAFDVRPSNFTDETDKMAQLQKAGEVGESLGLEWGGRWTEFIDPPHFQFTAGYSIADFKAEKIDWSKFTA